MWKPSAARIATWRGRRGNYLGNRGLRLNRSGTFGEIRQTDPFIQQTSRPVVQSGQAVKIGDPSLLVQTAPSHVDSWKEAQVTGLFESRIAPDAPAALGAGRDQDRLCQQCDGWVLLVPASCINDC